MYDTNLTVIVNKMLRGGKGACVNICNAQIWGIGGYINFGFIHIHRCVLALYTHFFQVLSVCEQKTT